MIAIGALCGIAKAAQISPQLLGKIDFPNSGSAEAQPAFIKGVLYLHNFEYEQAAASFKRAQETDPDFALAYWGEAMTHHHSIWEVQTRRQGRPCSGDSAARRKRAPPKLPR